MMTLDRMMERNQTVNLLALQCALRLSGSMGIGVLGAVRKTLDLYLVCLRHGVEHVGRFRMTDSPDRLVACYADAMTECVEKSWQDYRNNLQILLLAHDEALIWVSRIDQALLATD